MGSFRIPSSASKTENRYKLALEGESKSRPFPLLYSGLQESLALIKVVKSPFFYLVRKLTSYQSNSAWLASRSLYLPIIHETRVSI